jgi:hypothetical protein
MAIEDLINSFLAIGILAAFAVIIYMKVKKVTFTEMIKELNIMPEKKNGK